MAASAAETRRILIINGDKSVATEVRQALCGPAGSNHGPAYTQPISGQGRLEIESVNGIDPGVRAVDEARRQGNNFAVAFFDVKQLHETDVVATAQRILAADDDVQLVICIEREFSSCPVSEAVVSDHRLAFLSKPLNRLETISLTTSLLEKWRLARAVNSGAERKIEQVGETRRVMTIVESCLDELEDAHHELRKHAKDLTARLQQRTVEVIGTRDLTMFALAQLADSRDPETGEHLLRMRAYAQLLAEHLAKKGPYAGEIDQGFLKDFYRSTPLHDIGKVGIPDQILLKPGALTAEEYAVMKRHTGIGAEALERAARQSNFGDFLSMAASIARSHHEWFDGTGYPDGLAGQEIPLCARITTIADVYDALTSSRVYKAAMPPSEARALIQEQSGRQFDPVIVEAFEDCFESFLEVKATIDGGGDTVAPLVVLLDQAESLVAPVLA
jgi:putative two-component system response regulator